MDGRGQEEHSQYVAEYYFWDNALIFVYNRSTDYPDWTMQSEGKPDIEEERLYFNANRLVRRLGVKNQPKPTDTAEAQTLARDTQNAARRLVARLGRR